MSTFLSEAEAKILGAFIFVVIILGCWAAYHSNSTSLKAATKTIATQSGIITSQHEEIRVTGVVADVNQEVATTHEDAKVVVAKKQVVIQQKLDKTIHDIEQKFDALPVTEDNIIAKQDEGSSARIDSLWATYCTGVQDDMACPAPPPTGETKS